jgi:hypothetical protein
MLPRLFLAAGLVFALSAFAEAQPRRGQAAPQAQFTEPKEIEGPITGVMQGLIVITNTATTFPCRVIVPPNAKVQVTGTAKADYLRAGLLVEFQGEVDDRGALKDKVGELTVVAPSPDRHVGVFLPAADGEGAFGGAAPAKPAKRTGGAIAAGTYRIVSRLAAAGGKFSVKIGRNVTELTDEPKIKVNLSDYTLASKGDKATIKGMKAAGQEVIKAEEVKIELAEPLAGGVKKKTPAKAKAEHPKRSKKEKESGLPEPAAEK